LVNLVENYPPKVNGNPVLVIRALKHLDIIDICGRSFRAEIECQEHQPSASKVKFCFSLLFYNLF